MKKLSFLLYHEIGPYPRSTSNLDCFCTLLAFREQMLFLKENNISVISARDAHEKVINNKPDDVSSVVLTFDDGDISFLKYVLPILEEFGYSSTLFIVAGLIGEKALWARDYRNAIPLMTEAQLRSLNDNRIEIGSHSMTHPKLPELEIDDALSEVRDSKLKLEDMLDRQINSFAYPHGKYDTSIVELVKSAGYQYAYTTNEKRVEGAKNNMLLLPRKYITHNDDLNSFSRKILGTTP